MIQLKEGDIVPDFSMKILNSKIFNLSDLKAKKVILCYWRDEDREIIKIIRKVDTKNHSQQILDELST